VKVEDKKNEQDESLAAILLWNAACQLVIALHDWAQKRPELLLPITRQTFFFPGFISHKRAFNTDNDKLMERIELGVGGPYSTKQWRLSATSTQVAMFLHLLCRTYEKEWHLPPLTKKTKRLWFKRGWNHMVNDLGIVPEKDPHLAKLGKSATRERSGWDAKYRGHASDVRAEIKRQLWNAFNGLLA
jgi:hypothetical protein